MSTRLHPAMPEWPPYGVAVTALSDPAITASASSTRALNALVARRVGVHTLGAAGGVHPPTPRQRHLLGLPVSVARERHDPDRARMKIEHQTPNLVLGPPGSSSCLPCLISPFDHPADPTGPVWIRLDRQGTQPEQGRSVWSRPDRRRAPGYGSGGWGFESLAARQMRRSEVL
jgi:hypothetical protein